MKRTLALALACLGTGIALTAAGTGAAGAVGFPFFPPSTPKTVCQGPALTKADGTPWTCTFDDEFTGTRLDTTKWMAVTTANSGVAAGGTGANTACFVDSPNNISVANGVLSLTARKESAPFTCKSPLGSYTSQYSGAEVATYTKFFQTYGRFAVRAKFPASTIAGLQSALWMWPENLPSTNLSGEIDIAEEYSQYADRAIPTLHYSFDPTTSNTATNVNVATNNYCMISDVSAFHEYAVEWTSTTITVLYDGQTCLVDKVQSVGASPFAQPYFLLLTQALGIGTNAYDPANTPLPATTQIDWVRAWK